MTRITGRGRSAKEYRKGFCLLVCLFEFFCEINTLFPLKHINKVDVINKKFCRISKLKLVCHIKSLNCNEVMFSAALLNANI